MIRRVALAVLALLVAAPLSAQAPEGWMMRVDRSTMAMDPDEPGDVKFATMGSGFHATNPQAAVYWNPANTLTGNYTVKGTFRLIRPSDHNNFYGIVFGGRNLDGANQNYLYFLVSQEGTFLIKHRANDNTVHDVVTATANAAVQKPGENGRSTNALEVRVMADKIDYVVNGTVVHSTPKSGMTARTDGIYGIRVNHRLEVHIDGFSASAMQ